ncbi:MAG: hypothetical protein WAL61_07845 [Acidimicrobiales bacterium]
MSDAPQANRRLAIASGGTHRSRKCFGSDDGYQLVPGEPSAQLDLCGQRTGEQMSDEHGENRARDDGNDVDQSQLLPPVVNDEDAHQGDGGVEDSVDENGPVQAGQSMCHGRWHP